jgi:hypothetical protein
VIPLASATNLATKTADEIDLFQFVPGYHQHVVVSGKEPLLLLILSFLITFSITRLYTRLARVRGWGSGSVHGVHLHHMVVGILIVLASGLVAIATWPTGIGRSIIGVFFGAGAALTLDEFALSLYLKDVYWSPEGRSSIDATIMAVMLAALVFVGVSPFGIHESDSGPRWLAAAYIVLHVSLAATTFLKGKLMLGLVAIFFPLAGLIGAFRLAKPHSPWAHWFYRRNPEKLARARRRFEESDGWAQRVDKWFVDLIGGRPSASSPASSSPTPPEM